MSTIHESIADQLDRAMRRQRIKQYLVAERARLAPNTISRVLRARDVRVSTLVDIAHALGVQMQVTFVSSPPPPHSRS